jgi:DNA-binding response OmpR family regulator
LIRQEVELNTRVLIADSDSELRQRLYTRLLDLDIFSDCVNNAADAVERLNEYAYAVVIVDMGLPNAGIDDVVSRIGSIERSLRPIVLVLAATAEAARTLDVETVQIVLRRPVAVSHLVDLVRSCLRSSNAERRSAHGDSDESAPHDQAIS